MWWKFRFFVMTVAFSVLSRAKQFLSCRTCIGRRQQMPVKRPLNRSQSWANHWKTMLICANLSARHRANGWTYIRSHYKVSIDQKYCADGNGGTRKQIGWKNYNQKSKMFKYTFKSDFSYATKNIVKYNIIPLYPPLIHPTTLVAAETCPILKSEI